MKLYYDMLIAYMPDATINDEGKYVADNTKAAGRKAMVELSNFQNSGNIMALYQSVIYACTYAGADLVDTIYELFKPNAPISIEPNTSVEYLLDSAAMELFESIKPDITFDYLDYVAEVLMAIHILLVSNAAAPDTKETPAEPQIEANPTE
jgi:hypothetical protein